MSENSLLDTLRSLESLIAVEVPDDFNLKRVQTDITGEDALFKAITRAVENYPGGVAAIAKALELKPEALQKKIDALRDGGKRPLNANEAQKIVMLTGDRTPALAMLQGLGIEAYEKPELDIDPATLPILRAQHQQIYAITLYIETLQATATTECVWEEMLRITDKLVRAAEYLSEQIQAAEEKSTATVRC